MKLLKILIAILVISFIASCSNNDFSPVSIEHAKGESKIQKIPNKIIVLDAATLDNLDSLGVNINGVPEINLGGYLAKYQDAKYLKVGTLFEPNLEIIKNNKPDLIIVGEKSSSKYKQLAEIAPTLDLSIKNDNYIESAQNRITQLGQIFGKTSNATSLNSNISHKIARLKARSSTAGRAVVIIINEGKINAISPKGRMGWLYHDAGFAPISANLEQFTDENPMPLEFLAAQNPDWIFVIERDSAIGKGTAETAAKKVLNREEIRQTTAWHKGQIVYLHPQESYIISNGYQALTKIIQQIQSALDEAK